MGVEGQVQLLEPLYAGTCSTLHQVATAGDRLYGIETHIIGQEGLQPDRQLVFGRSVVVCKSKQLLQLLRIHACRAWQEGCRCRQRQRRRRWQLQPGRRWGEAAARALCTRRPFSLHKAD